MPTTAHELIDLETRFWQSMVDRDTETAIGLLAEPALMVGPHGAMTFDHAGYRQMAEQGTMVLTAFKLGKVEVVSPNETTAVLSYRVKQSMADRGGGKNLAQEMHDTSTWAMVEGDWKCVGHTETPIGPDEPH